MHALPFPRWLVLTAVSAALLAVGIHSPVEAQTSVLPSPTAAIPTTGTVNVIVSLNVATSIKLDRKASNSANRETLNSLLPIYAQARNTLTADLASYHAVEYAGQNWIIPSLALRVDQATLDHLRHSPLVASIALDNQLKLTDTASDALIGAPVVWNAGPAPGQYTGGNGQTVAVLDTGVQEDHPFFNGRVVAEACFSGSVSGSTSLCPNGNTSQYGAGAAVNCPYPSINPTYTDCLHGTHVAGIAVGNGFGSGGIGYSGVAIASNLIPIQVFSVTGGNLGTYDSDIIRGLSWLNTISTSFPIAAANMSIGNSALLYSGACDSVNPSMTNIFATLRGIGIAPVVAAGNDSNPNVLSYPACISKAISVGAVDNSDNVTSFSDRGPQMTIFAPGKGINSSIPGSSYGSLDGTSMSAPHVSGAFAVLRSYDPVATVDQLQGLITKTGKLIYSSDTGNTQPRLQLDQAFKVMFPQLKTIGVYRNNIFLLRGSNSSGYADGTIPFGSGPNILPIVGDWTASGIDRLGIYNQSTGVFILCLTATNPACAGAGSSNLAQFTLGNPGDTPIAGFWNPRASYSGSTLIGYAVEGAGVFRPSNGLLYLKDQLATGYADHTMVLGVPGDVGIAGDWNGDGQGSPGIYRPSNAGFYLSNQVTNGIVYADTSFTYGDGYNDVPVVGNWTGAPSSYGLGAGIYRTTTGYFMLHNALNTGVADNAFFYGLASDQPVVGTWGSLSSSTRPDSPSIQIPRLPATPIAPTQNSSGGVQSGNGVGG